MIKAERIESDRSIECMQFYQHVIADTPDMDQYGRWKNGLYPTEKDIERYIEKGAMYVLAEDDAIIGAMAVTMNQGDDYHSIHWALPLADDEVSVIHVLAVRPEDQGRGFGERLIEEAVLIARNAGKKALRLDALAGNTPAHHLYAKKGFAYRGKQNLYVENTGWTDFFFFELEL
jgi:ribosomal protein S18 acetylase RimI-like enzyme